MKRFLVLTLAVLMLLPILSVTAIAAPTDKLVSTTTEYLENGSYTVTNVYESAIQPRTGKSGYATTTYYASNGSKIFGVTVNGTFSYVEAVTSAATGATASVSIYSNKASFVSKNAYTSGATAIATGTVNYSGDTITKTVTLTCDKYGNLY